MLSCTPFIAAVTALAVGSAAFAQTAPLPSDVDPAPAVSAEPAQPEMEAIVQAYRDGDYVTARNGLAQLAPGGTPNAKYRYGRILFEGLGGPRDPAAAAHWLQQAADADHLEAVTLLARLYLSGDGVEADARRAVSLLQRAATQGDRGAQYLLGRAYQSGEGTAQDDAAAFNWYLAAAKQQHAQAELELSRAYAQGRGTKADPQKALDHMQSAAVNGLPEAQFLLALNLDRPGSEAEALVWFRRAAENGVPSALRMLGTRYLTGTGVDKNPDEAIRLLTRAADLGDAAAMSNLGYVFASGDGALQDDATAFDWYSRAARGGLPRGMLALALFYETGRGTDRDIGQALKYYTRALEAGADQAASRLGRLALAGDLDGRVSEDEMATWIATLAKEGDSDARAWLDARSEAGLSAARLELASLLLAAPETRDQAADLLEQTARAGNPTAQFRLGEFYAAGDTGTPDPIKAHMWYNIAAAAGSVRAAEMRAIVAQLMTPEQVATAQGLARAYLEELQSGTAAASDQGRASE